MGELATARLTEVPGDSGWMGSQEEPQQSLIVQAVQEAQRKGQDDGCTGDNLCGWLTESQTQSLVGCQRWGYERTLGRAKLTFL
jgi:hypothetical protein